MGGAISVAEQLSVPQGEVLLNNADAAFVSGCRPPHSSVPSFASMAVLVGRAATGAIRPVVVSDLPAQPDDAVSAAPQRGELASVSADSAVDPTLDVRSLWKATARES